PNGFDQADLDRFKEFASCGLIGDFPLHMHQLEMLRKGLAKENLVVTAGTGSGKTEAFLMPILAQLVQESKNWQHPGPVHANQGDWWLVNHQRRVSQRANEHRPAAIRALLLYPMNALVEDQLTRLRRALDSPAAQEWYRNNIQGNRFYFGRYNGETPIPGNEGDPGRLTRLKKALKIIDDTQTEARKYDNDNNNGNGDVRYFFPSVDGAEMRCRWDMQDAPPDIL
ncbi:MAG: DEAD/DEAH box helicase, partial [bacterium]|nr:DEAD/DEAH box helicase [bacterium]